MVVEKIVATVLVVILAVQGVRSQDPCAANPCVAGQCVRMGNGYYCNCVAGFTGTNCSKFEGNCASNPCQNGGTCQLSTSVSGGYVCRCLPGSSGYNCEYSNCTASRCGVGETCFPISVSPGYLCHQGDNCHYPPCGNIPDDVPVFYYPNWVDCNTYWKCNNKRASLETCPFGMVFDFANFTCETQDRPLLFSCANFLN